MKSGRKPSGSSGKFFTAAERKEAVEIMKEDAIDYSKDGKDIPPKIPDENTEISQYHAIAAAVILTDLTPENEAGSEKDAFKKFRNACERAGLLDGGTRERAFFRILADPKFQKATKELYWALTFTRLPKVVDKWMEKAEAGEKVYMQWALQYWGFIKDKFQFYLDRVELKKTEYNVGGDLNFQDIPDAELEKHVHALRDVTEEAEITA